MKRNRIILGICWIISLIGISFFGGPVSYGFFTLFTILPIISILYLLGVYLCFHIYQELGNKDLVVNRTVPFYFTLINEFPIAFSGIRVRFFSSFSTINGLDDRVEYELFPGTGIRMDTDMVCKYRGEYEIGIKEVIVQDYFRLFKLSYKNTEALRVMVRPALICLEELRSIDLVEMMMRETTVNPNQADVLVRKYEPGDDVRQIHWKVTARTGQVMVRGRIGEEQEGIGVIMSSRRFFEEQESYLPLENKILESTIALIYYFCRKQIPVTTYCRRGELQRLTGAGMEDFQGIYEKLSGTEFSGEHSEAVLLEEVMRDREIFRKKAVFLVVHEWSGQLLQVLKRLMENQVQAVLYLVGDEIPEQISAENMKGLVFQRIPTDAVLSEVM